MLVLGVGGGWRESYFRFQQLNLSEQHLSGPLVGQQSPSEQFTDRGHLCSRFSCHSWLGHGGNCPRTAGRRTLAIIYCTGFDPGAGPGWVLPTQGVSPVVLRHFPAGNIVSEPLLTEICPNSSQKPSVKKSSSSPRVTYSSAVRNLFLPRLLNFQCKPVTLNSFTSWPRE